MVQRDDMNQHLQRDQSLGRIQRKSLATEFESPEGIYQQVKTREHGLVRFDYYRPVQLTLVRITKPEEQINQMYIIFNIGEFLHIQRYYKIDEQPSFRQIVIPKNGKESDTPKCHAWNNNPSSPLLAVGTKSGDVLIINLHKQITLEGNKPMVVSQFQQESEGQLGMCTDIAWIPDESSSEVARIVAAFSSGAVLILQKTGGSRDLIQVGELQHDNGSKSITAVACSPDGLTVATACRDGVLRLFDLRLCKCTGGFKGYYGALLCVGWSPDGLYVVTGGEDDLIAVYGVREKNVVAWGEGHKSWVSAVAFDIWCSGKESGESSTIVKGGAQLSEKERVYRIGSVGQDTMICLWDIQVDEDEVQLLMQQRSSNFSSTNAPPINLFRTSGGMVKTKSMGALKALERRANSIEEDQPLKAETQDSVLTHARREDMEMVFPVNKVKIHNEPISCIVYMQEIVFTADHSGAIKAWFRPEIGDEEEDDENEDNAKNYPTEAAKQRQL
eukprot:TRINITY_DN6554_c0_g1_i1.p1 TRINITY_DN6554_c0_g1~~TRINITY_DN6554_c0_g1_i1.p1  ORF type:complete len:501 (+),score=90.02 TRINITY_DN6554_c0_g1_i1:154-1656(+)